MSAENLKAPLKGDGKFGLEFTRDYRRRNSRKLHLLTGVTFLIVINVSLFIVVIFALSRVRKLENRLDILESDLAQVKIEQDIVMEAILGYEDEDLSEEDQDQDAQSGREFFLELSDLMPEDYSDYDIDQVVVNVTEENDTGKYQVNATANLTTLNDFRHASDLTKDGKETSREKRSIVAATQDGVLINSESYAERKAKNITRHRIHSLKGYNVTPVSAKPSYFGVSPWPSSHHYNSEEATATPHVPSYRRDHTKHPSISAPVFTRRSRVMHNEDRSKAFRQVVKKSSLKSGDSYSDETTADSSFTIVRDDFPRRRNGQRRIALENLDENHPRVGRIKLASAHFSGDTSKYVVGQHTNFNGNGHLRHPQRTFVDWKISEWVKSVGMDTQFNMEEGVLTIKEPGIYFIYAQIYYLDEHDTTGFRVHKNGETVLQCTVTAHSSERRLKGNTCYTAGAEYLSEGDRLSLADVTGGRYSLFEPGKSFFGLIKLGDVKIN